jgi:catechol 2,3-dioxygenase-like lactoylglutathione lyase family enzyme
MEMTVEKISAITLRVADMRRSVRFYRDVLGMEVLYGGEDWQFSSLRAKGSRDLILNLEPGRAETQWGRLIFYVPDVDEFSSYLKAKGFQAESPRDGSWGERYFHLYDPDGHQLSFARPLQ